MNHTSHCHGCMTVKRVVVTDGCFAEPMVRDVSVEVV